MAETQDPNLHEVVELAIENAVYGGESIARLKDGKTIFVPHVLSGEIVRVKITESKKNYSKGSLEKIITPSEKRILPRCAHFGECGGCHYQHLAYADQLALKQKILTDQLIRIGKISNPPVKPIIPSSDIWNYRNTMQFHVSDRGRLGFRKTGSHDTLEISECHLPTNAINDLWPILDIDPAFRVDRVVVRNGLNDNLLLGLECDHDEAPDFSLDIPLSVTFLGKNQDLLLSGEPYTNLRVKDFDFLVSARSFFQVNLPLAQTMVEYVLKTGNFLQEAVVYDLYCGVGLFSRFIAPIVKEVIGVELSESACNDYAANLDAFENVSLYIGGVEDVLPSLTAKPDVILIDPPRSGLERSVLERICRSTARQVIYVSCDPTTLARDSRVLIEQGYALKDVQPFDLFPQTFHMESIAIFNKE